MSDDKDACYEDRMNNMNSSGEDSFWFGLDWISIDCSSRGKLKYFCLLLSIVCILRDLDSSDSLTLILYFPLCGSKR